MSYLENISSPADIKKISLSGLEILAGEIREAILNKVSQTGGHVGPDLGIVETTIALHRVFHSPQDKIVFDVSHQCYPHKILTGRKNGFLNNDELTRYTGYTNPGESEHDFFTVGHTSTSLSLACGLAKARDILHEQANIIALIGDGSLGGGQAFEGLSNAAELKSNIIIVVNDNEMSIAENHGGLYTALQLLRDTNGTAACNFFKALGFDYTYVADGHSLPDLIETFERVKDTPRPTVVHIHTQKGKGYAPAEADKEAWHWNVPFDIATGHVNMTDSGDSYPAITADYLLNKIKQDDRTVVVNAGTPGLFGFSPDTRAQMKDHYVDTGITEQHAVGFTSALAKGGCKPVFLVHSSFIQRAYDQLSQDLAINNNPAVILIFNGGISGMDVTHLGVFDISLISNIPNILYLSPATKQEYLAMLDWAMDQTSRPVVIRVPNDVYDAQSIPPKTYDTARFETVQAGDTVAVAALGEFFETGRQVVKNLADHGIRATLINPRFVSDLDEKTLTDLRKNHRLVVTVEDGELDGGWGEKIARFYGPTDMKVMCFGAKKEFTDRVPTMELYRRYHLTPEAITDDILNALK